MRAETGNGGAGSEDLPSFDRDAQYLELVSSMRRVRPLALLGAGTSVASGYPSWGDLLTQLAQELVKLGPDYIAPKHSSVVQELQDPAWQAEEFFNALGPERFYDFIRHAFRDKDVAEPHHLIARLGFRHILTTNFESCAALSHQKLHGRMPKQVDWCKPDQVQSFFIDLTDPNAETSVVYLHGHAGDPQNVVLTESAYGRTYLREENRRRLIALFMTQPVVFIGFSMNDPDLAQIMREVLFSLPVPRTNAAGADGGRRLGMRHFGVFGYRTAAERDLIRRRMEGKFGLQTVFYRIVALPDGKTYSHDNLMALLDSIGQDAGWEEGAFGDIPVSPAAAQSSGAVITAPVGGDRMVPLGRLTSDEVDPYDLDPNKGAFGGMPARDGFALRASQIEVDGNWVSFDLLVEAEEEASFSEPVTFFFHPTFQPSMEKIKALRGKASTSVRAVGAFTVGAEVCGTRLELDLADDPRFPAWFREG